MNVPWLCSGLTRHEDKEMSAENENYFKNAKKNRTMEGTLFFFNKKYSFM